MYEWHKEFFQGPSVSFTSLRDLIKQKDLIVRVIKMILDLYQSHSPANEITKPRSHFTNLSSSITIY